MVKTEGWINTCETLGLSGEELAEMFFNDDPMEFLNLYNGLDIVQSEKIKGWTLFRNKPNHNLMIYIGRLETVYIRLDEIWSFLEEGFNFNNTEIQELTEKWLDETYNLRGVTKRQFYRFV